MVKVDAFTFGVLFQFGGKRVMLSGSLKVILLGFL